MLYRASKQISQLIVTFQKMAKEMVIPVQFLRPAICLITQNMKLICHKRNYDTIRPMLRLITDKEIDFVTFHTKIGEFSNSTGDAKEYTSIVTPLIVLRKLCEGDIEFYQQQFSKLLEKSGVQLLNYVIAVKKIATVHVLDIVMVNDPLYIQAMEETKRIRMRYAESVRKKEAMLQQTKTESLEEQKTGCDFVKGPS